MFSGSTLSRAICTAFVSAALCIGAFGDTIHLKDGSIIKGRIVSFSGGIFVVAIGEGSRRREMTFTASEVESIQFDSPQVETRAAQTRPGDSVKGTGQEDNTYRPVSVTKKQPEQSDTTPPGGSPVGPTSGRTNASPVKPVELNVRVMADNTANGWTNSGWVVKKGQRIHISGSGEVSIGRGKKVTPSGAYDIEDTDKLLKNVPTGALLAVIGDDNNDFIYIGSDREFTAERDGALFLGINEGNLNDNAGNFDVKIEIRPEADE